MSAAPLVIVGAGGFAREVLDVAEACDREVLGFVADPAPDPAVLGPSRPPYLGGLEALRDQPRSVEVVIGIGHGGVRRRIDAQVTEWGFASGRLVHPTAVLGRHGVDLAPGVVVCPLVIITTDVTVGRHVHLNLHVSLGHDVRVDAWATLSPGVAVSGGVHIGEEVTIGSGASLIPSVHVAPRATIGAGACVIRDVPEGTTAVGVPAKVVGR